VAKTVRQGDVFGHEAREGGGQEAPANCPQCGYRLRSHDKSCPNCGYSFQSEAFGHTVNDGAKEKEEQQEQAAPTKPAGGGQKTCPQCKTMVALTANFCAVCGHAFTVIEKPEKETLNPWAAPVIPPPVEEIPTYTCSLTIVPAEKETIETQPIVFSGKEIILTRGNTEPENQAITSKMQALLSYEDDKWFIEDRSQLRTTFVHAGEKRELKAGDVLILGNRRFIFNP
jgi:RNA polymerase subunit RPABC4/transcription elongation factor Spt4